MIRRYETKFGSVTLYRRDGAFDQEKKLEFLVGAGQQIVKRFTTNQKINEISYVLLDTDRPLAIITGYLRSPLNYYISRIENSSGDKTLGYSVLSRLYASMEEDLKQQGVAKVSTSALFKLAPIAIKRFGFSDVRGRTSDQLKRSWAKYIPGVAAGLEKSLI